MAYIKHIIKLNEKEKAYLHKVIEDPSSSERHITRAKILLKSDMSNPQRMTLEQMIEEFKTTAPTINLTRQNYVRFGVEGAVKGKQRETPPITPKVTKQVEAQILHLLWSPPPAGKRKWTHESLAEKVKEEGILESISKAKIGQILKKYGLSTKL